MDYEDHPILKLDEKDLIRNKSPSNLENLAILSFAGAVGGVVLAKLTEPYLWKVVDTLDYAIKYFSH
ncbi:MAG: hypothetical protein WC584_01680 [Candidatus Pacearchaeota archaeon]